MYLVSGPQSGPCRIPAELQERTELTGQERHYLLFNAFMELHAFENGAEVFNIFCPTKNNDDNNNGNSNNINNSR